jgi:MoaA/NifB/PqqE/SkfB family radical SAM enzyme
MSEELRRIEELEKEIRKLKGLNEEGIPVYSFSKMTDKKLKNLVNIEKLFNRDIFNNWFNFEYKIIDEDINFFLKLIDKFRDFIDDFKEEDLKIYYISQILNRVDFILIKDRYSGLYNEPLKYKTDKFILKGEVDFIFAKGLTEAIKPYFLYKNSKELKNLVIQDHNY